MKAQGLPKNERIRKSEDFTRILREGVRARGKLLDARWCARENSDDEATRVGVAAGRRLGNAATRNRLKRRIREAYRRNKGELPCRGTDIVFFATARMLHSAATEVEEDMQHLLRQIAAASRSR